MKKKKTKSTFKQRKFANMTFIWLLVHWFTEGIPKSAKDWFTRYAWLTARVLRLGRKNYSAVTSFHSKNSFNKKPKRTFK